MTHTALFVLTAARRRGKRSGLLFPAGKEDLRRSDVPANWPIRTLRFPQAAGESGQLRPSANAVPTGGGNAYPAPSLVAELAAAAATGVVVRDGRDAAEADK